MNQFSIWIVEYARVPEAPVGVFLNGHEGRREIPYCFAVLESDVVTTLVDCGYQDEGKGRELAQEDGVAMFEAPAQMLHRLGIGAEDVTSIIITHAHYDHMGGLASFPNATVFIQRREVERWAWALSLPARMSWLKQSVNEEDLLSVIRCGQEGRLVMVEGHAKDILPGISLVPDFDTHTYGHQHVVVNDETTGPWVVPGDLIYLYANIEEVCNEGSYVPIGVAMGSQENGIMGMEGVMSQVDWNPFKVLPLHEHLLWERFPSVVTDCGMHIAEIQLRPSQESRLPR
jgi:N-acyl homoserine lactone hydrolase